MPTCLLPSNTPKFIGALAEDFRQRFIQAEAPAVDPACLPDGLIGAAYLCPAPKKLVQMLREPFGPIWQGGFSMKRKPHTPEQIIKKLPAAATSRSFGGTMATLPSTVSTSASTASTCHHLD